ncbi:MAG: ArsR/SmtB family transcription factor [Phycisphaerales bacterium]
MAPERASAVMSRQAGVFAALGDETRLSLLTALGRSGDLSISRLSEGRSVTRQAITKHLRIMTRAGLVRGVRRGREVRYILQPSSLALARQSLDRISAQWDAALMRLKDSIENDTKDARS